MKTNLFLGLMLSMGILNVRAALFSSGPLNALIPDNNANGYLSTITVSGQANQLQTLSVNLNVSGGYNGDLYAYLLGPNGQLTVLLNRAGSGGGNSYGYSDTGFNLTLSDGGVTGLHNYQSNGGSLNGDGQLTGSWQPDSGGWTFANRYGGMDPNGTWSLFFADQSQGSQSTLEGWSLDITAVPEPITTALSVFGMGMMAVALMRYWRRSHQRNQRFQRSAGY
jgi:subtilisin-like proprotein convertase family protein